MYAPSVEAQLAENLRTELDRRPGLASLACRATVETGIRTVLLLAHVSSVGPEVAALTEEALEQAVAVTDVDPEAVGIRAQHNGWAITW
jgi:hypothetical protein